MIHVLHKILTTFIFDIFHVIRFFVFNHFHFLIYYTYFEEFFLKNKLYLDNKKIKLENFITHNFPFFILS